MWHLLHIISISIFGWIFKSKFNTQLQGVFHVSETKYNLFIVYFEWLGGRNAACSYLSGSCVLDTQADKMPLWSIGIKLR